MTFLTTLFDEIWDKKGPFLFTFFFVCALSYGILFAIDFIPEKPEVSGEDAAVVTDPAPAPAPVAEPVVSMSEGAQYPTRIVIPELGSDVDVLNPQSRSIADLDAALLSGVVRHPDSADFKNTGTMVLFGHSSYLPTVRNKNFQAFNGLQKLAKGDMVSVFSEETEYVYVVTSVYKAAASDASVDLEKGKETLVLITCNSFGSKDDRFVVEAKLVEKKPL